MLSATPVNNKFIDLKNQLALAYEGDSEQINKKLDTTKSIYADDFMRSQQEENEQMGMYDEDENRLFKNTDTNGRFHSDWCSMMYSRLMLARNLLTDDGVIFISIDDNEQENLKKLCDEVFGESNYICPFIWEKTQHFGRQKLNSYCNND